MASMQAGAPRRPRGVTALATLDFVMGALLGILSLLFLLLQLSGRSRVPRGTGMTLAAVFLALSLVLVVLGWGLWKGRSWAWWSALAIYAAGLVSALLALVDDPLRGVIGLAIQGLFVWTLTRAAARRWFRVKLRAPWRARTHQA